MKRKYILLNLILFVFLILSTTTLSVLAVTPKLELIPACQSVNQGSQATIEVVIKDVTDLKVANITLNFDASELQYVSSADGGFIPNASLLEQWDNTNGTLNLDIAGMGASAYASGNGTIFSVVFIWSGTAATNICFGTTILRDKNNNIIYHNTGDCCTICSLPGDFNGDCVVDFEDLMIFAMAYGSCSGDIIWNPICDIASSGGLLTPDGCIDFDDLMVFSMHYGETCADL